MSKVGLYSKLLAAYGTPPPLAQMNLVPDSPQQRIYIMHWRASSSHLCHSYWGGAFQGLTFPRYQLSFPMAKQLHVISRNIIPSYRNARLKIDRAARRTLSSLSADWRSIRNQTGRVSLTPISFCPSVVRSVPGPHYLISWSISILSHIRPLSLDWGTSNPGTWVKWNLVWEAAAIDEAKTRAQAAGDERQRFTDTQKRRDEIRKQSQADWLWKLFFCESVWSGYYFFPLY